MGNLASQKRRKHLFSVTEYAENTALPIGRASGGCIFGLKLFRLAAALPKPGFSKE